MAYAQGAHMNGVLMQLWICLTIKSKEIGSAEEA